MPLGVAIPAAMAALSGAIIAGVSGMTGLINPFVGVGLLAALLLMVWRPQAAIWLLIGGWVFVGIHQEWASQLPVGLNGEDVVVDATLLSVTASGGSQRLLLSVNACEAPSDAPSFRALQKVRVTAYGDSVYQAGEQWRLTLRLRPQWFC